MSFYDVTLLFGTFKYHRTKYKRHKTRGTQEPEKRWKETKASQVCEKFEKEKIYVFLYITKLALNFQRFRVIKGEVPTTCK